MNKNIIATIITAMLAVPAGTVAADTNLSYSFAEFGYTDRDFDGPSADGFVLNGSFGITDMVFLYGGYTDLSGDFDNSTLNVGAGIAIGLNEMIDLYGKLGYLSNDVGPFDDTGVGLEVGLRAMVAEQVEVFGNLQYVDIWNTTETALEAGGRFWFMDNMGVSASYTDGDFSGSGVTIAGRFNF